MQTELDKKVESEVSIGSDADLEFSDEEGNVLVRFADGHIKTKNFDSSKVTPTPTPTPSSDSPIENFLKGKTVAFLGDSITAGSGASSNTYRYSTVFSTLAGCTEKNLGVGGTCLCANTKNGLSSQRFITRATSANLSSADFIIIFGGTNDFSYDIKAIGDHFAEETIEATNYRGTKRKIPTTDNETFSGALHELIAQVRSLKPATPIVFVTPLNRNYYQSSDFRPSSKDCNTNGDFITDYVDAIKDICQYYSIPVFVSTDHFPADFAQETLSSKVTGCSSDCLHPNDKGHAILAKLLYKWILCNCSLI